MNGRFQKEVKTVAERDICKPVLLRLSLAGNVESRLRTSIDRFFWDSQWLKIWKNHLCPSMGPNGAGVVMDKDRRDRGYGLRMEGRGSVAMDSEWSGYGLRMEEEWLWTLTGMSLHSAFLATGSACDIFLWGFLCLWTNQTKVIICDNTSGNYRKKQIKN